MIGVRPAAALTLSAALLAAPSALAGPWGLERGHVYFKLGYGRLPADTLANPDASQVGIPHFLKQDLSLYGAVGLGAGLTLSTNVPLWRSSDLENFREEGGFGDVQAGLQYQVGKRGPWLFAVRGTLQAPTGDETRADGILPTGTGVWEGQAVLSAGRSFAGGRGFGFVEAGPQVRQTLNDGFVYAAQLGWNAGSRVVLIANLDGVEPYDKAPRAVALGSPVGFGDRVTYLNYGPSLIFKLGGGLGLQLDLSRVARARNIAVGTSWRAGFSYSR